MLLSVSFVTLEISFLTAGTIHYSTSPGYLSTLGDQIIQAIVALEDVVLFLQHKGNTEEAMSLGSTIDAMIVSAHVGMLQPFKPHWTVFFNSRQSFIVHSEFKLRTQTQFRFVSFLVLKLFFIHIYLPTCGCCVVRKTIKCCSYSSITYCHVRAYNL